MKTEVPRIDRLFLVTFVKGLCELFRARALPRVSASCLCNFREI